MLCMVSGFFYQRCDKIKDIFYWYKRLSTSFSGHRFPAVEHSAAARHIGAITDCP